MSILYNLLLLFSHTKEQAMTAAATAARDAAEKEALLAREAEQKMRDELKELTECFYDTLMAHSSLETREKVEIMSVMKVSGFRNGK